MTPIRTAALAALRDGRVAIVLADKAVLGPTVEPPAVVVAFVESSLSEDPANPTGYFVDLAAGHWTCTCQRDDCPHIAAVQLCTGHPSAAAKEAA